MAKRARAARGAEADVEAVAAADAGAGEPPAEGRAAAARRAEPPVHPPAPAAGGGGRRSSRPRGALRAACAGLALALALAGAAPYAGAEGEAIDINTASAADLASLPGIGPAKAQAIIAYRETTPFRSAEDLIQVKGIGERLYAQLKDRIRVGAAPTRGASGGEAARAAGGGASGGSSSASAVGAGDSRARPAAAQSR